MSESFDGLAWCAAEIEKQGNLLSRVMGERPRLQVDDRVLHVRLHSAVGQLAQVLGELRRQIVARDAAPEVKHYANCEGGDACECEYTAWLEAEPAVPPRIAAEEASS